MMTSGVASEYVAITQQGGGGDEEQDVVIDDASILAETRDLKWNDTYYADNQIEVIAVFDVNYEKTRRSMWCWGMCCIFWIFVINGFFMFATWPHDKLSALIWISYSLAFSSMVVHSVQRQLEGVMGLHVAVTKEGIRKELNKSPGIGSLFMTTTIIPYNEIKAIKAQRSSCCDTGTVLIQSTEGNTWNEILGLLDNSEAFISLVNAMIARNPP